MPRARGSSDPLVQPVQHLPARCLEPNHVAVFAVGCPVIEEALEFGGVHVVNRQRVIHDYHIIPVGGMDSCEVAPLDALEVVADLLTGERGLAALNAGHSLRNIAAGVKRRVSVLGAAEALAQLIRGFREFAAVHPMLAVERIRRATMRGVILEMEIHGKSGLFHADRPFLDCLHCTTNDAQSQSSK